MQKFIYILLLGCFIVQEASSQKIFKIGRVMEIDGSFDNISYGVEGSGNIEVRVFFSNKYEEGGRYDHSLLFGFNNAGNNGNCLNTNCNNWQLNNSGQWHCEESEYWCDNDDVPSDQPIKYKNHLQQIKEHLTKQQETGGEFVESSEVVYVNVFIELELDNSTELNDVQSITLPGIGEVMGSEFTHGNPSEPMDLILFIGQSNAAGRAPAVQEDQIFNFDGIFLINDHINNNFEPAAVIRNDNYLKMALSNNEVQTLEDNDVCQNDPDKSGSSEPCIKGTVTNDCRNQFQGFNRHSWIKKIEYSGQRYAQRLNPAWAFAKELVEKDGILNNPVGIISEARGGIASAFFLKTSSPPNSGKQHKYAPGSNFNMYQAILARLTNTKSNYPNATLKAVVVSQGESDLDGGATEQKVATWAINWRLIISDLRAELEVPDDVPFIFTELAKSNDEVVEDHVLLNTTMQQLGNGRTDDDLGEMDAIYFVSSTASGNTALPLPTLSPGVNGCAVSGPQDPRVHFSRVGIMGLGKNLSCVYEQVIGNNSQLLDGRCGVDDNARRAYNSETPVVETPDDKFDFTIYPNPTTDLLHIVLDSELREEEFVKIDLFDLSGKRVHTETVPVDQDIIDLDLRDSEPIATGLYSLRIQWGKIVRHHRIRLK